jgi:hypothetical protein
MGQPRHKTAAKVEFHGFDEWNHPLRQRLWWGYPALYPAQQQFLRACSKVNSWTGASFGNGMGKTFLMSLFGLSVMAAFPGAQVISTAGVEEQIKLQLFRHIAAAVRPFESTGWRYNADALWVRAPSFHGLPPSTWNARVPRSEETFQGFHQKEILGNDNKWHYCPTCLIYDECREIPEERYLMAQTIVPTWFVAVSSPGSPRGWFYDAIDPNRFTT